MYAKNIQIFLFPIIKYAYCAINYIDKKGYVDRNQYFICLGRIRAGFQWVIRKKIKVNFALNVRVTTRFENMLLGFLIVRCKEWLREAVFSIR